MSTVVTLVNTSPSIALGEKLEELTERLKELLPNLDLAISKLNIIEKRFCKPLLLKNPQELEKYFTSTLPLFMFNLVSAMLPLSNGIFMKVEEEKDTSILVKLRELEKELFKEIKLLLKKAAREKRVSSEPIIMAHAAAIDYDLWLIDMIIELGLQGFVERIIKRASGISDDFVKSLYSLFYVMMSVDVALLSGAPYRKDTLDILVERCSHYAKEVEDYLDTLIFLIPDEEYRAVTEFLKSEAHGQMPDRP